jgi:hypothetical protein
MLDQNSPLVVRRSPLVTNNSRDAETQNLEALRSAFTEALRNAMVGRNRQSENSATKNAEEQPQKQHHEQSRDWELQTQRRDFTKENKQVLDKRALDKSEIRHSDIEADYAQGIDRQTWAVRQPQPTSPPSESTLSAAPPVIPPTSLQATPPNVTPLSSSPVFVPSTTPLQLSTVVPASYRVANSQQIPLNAESETVGVPVFCPPAGNSSPINTVTVNALSAVSAMTIFTITGKFGQIKNEDKDEKRNSAYEKKKDRKTAISLFNQIAFETTQNQEQNIRSLRDVQQQPDQQPESAENQNFSVQHSKTDGNNTSKEPDEALTDKISLKDFLDEKQPAKEQEEPDEAVLELLRRMSGDFVQRRELSEPAAKQLDRFQWIQRVTAACKSAANQNGTIRFKLNLDRLGTLTLKITSQSNRLSVRFETASDVAAQMIREDLDELKSVLAEQEIVLESVEVAVNFSP